MGKKIAGDFIDKFKIHLNEKVGDKNIIEWSNYLAQINKTAFEVQHTGTLFKLYSMYSYLIFPYLPILGNMRRRNKTLKLIYIDFFSGSGLNVIVKNNRTYICGSAILALLASIKLTKTNQNYYFDQMILIDNKKENLSILNSRLELLSKLTPGLTSAFDLDSTRKANVFLIEGDTTKSSFILRINGHLENIIKSCPIHIMFFVDPDTPESLRMSSFKTLLSFPGDLIMLLHPGIFAEMVNKRRYARGTLKEILDVDDSIVKDLYEKTHNPTYLQKFYVNRITDIVKSIDIKKIMKGSNKRDIVITVDIRTNSNYYVLLYATRTTGGTDYKKWQEGFQRFASRIGDLSDSGSSALRVLFGYQDQISKFF